MTRLSFFAPTCLALALFPAVGCVPQPEGGAATEDAAGEAAESTPVTAELMAHGKEVYTLWCANCHGTSGAGDGPDAMVLDPKPRDQTDPTIMDALSDRDIAETVVYGGAPRGYPNMPAMPQVFGEDLVGLVAYVRSFSQADVASVGLTADSPL